MSPTSDIFNPQGAQLMSQGNPFIGIRIPEALVASVNETVERYNRACHTREPIDRNEFIRRAIAEKVAKMARSRRRPAAKTTARPAPPGQPAER